jgi:hypothetical protein
MGGKATGTAGQIDWLFVVTISPQMNGMNECTYTYASSPSPLRTRLFSRCRNSSYHGDLHRVGEEGRKEKKSNISLSEFCEKIK